MKVELQIKNKSFTDDDGVLVNYKSYEISIGGCVIPIKIRDKDKSLVEYLLCNKN